MSKLKYYKTNEHGKVVTDEEEEAMIPDALQTVNEDWVGWKTDRETDRRTDRQTHRHHCGCLSLPAVLALQIPREAAAQWREERKREREAAQKE